MVSKKQVVLLLLLFMLMASFFQIEGNAAIGSFDFGSRILKPGVEGPDVAILQRKLQELGYYEGKIDGLYGPGTKDAVISFQKSRQASTVDGVVGGLTYQLFPKRNLDEGMSVSRAEIIMLARIIHGEARGESFRGKVAVGAVIINRIKSRKFPNTIREVVLQKGQFSSLMDGQANYYPGPEEIEAARAALLGYDPTYGAIFFYNPQVATNKYWISRRPVLTQIGGHVFLS